MLAAPKCYCSRPRRSLDLLIIEIVLRILADSLECPFGTLAYGMTISMPGTTYWRDPEKGPPTESDRAIPFSVCLFCFRISTQDGEGTSEEFESFALQTNSKHSPSYHVCIGKGMRDLLVSRELLNSGQKWTLQYFAKRRAKTLLNMYVFVKVGGELY